MQKNKQNNIFDDINIILDSTIEGIIIIEKGFIVNVNDSLIQILEYKTKDELIGNLATGVLIPSTTEKFIEYNRHIFQEVTLVSNNGDLIPAIIKIKDIKLKNNNYKVVSILDLREFKQKEMLLFKQSRLAAMGEMISMIAHQWRQPLSAIGSVVSRLKFKLATNKIDKEDLNEKLNEVNNYLQYMSKTIDDFRNFFKDDKQKEFLDLNETINNAISMLKPTLESHNIILDKQNIALSKILAYKNEVIQVILNVLNNAIDAIIENEIKEGKITITLEEKNNYQRVYIKDNAGGVPKEIINRIFEPYFSTKINKNGTGLGLHMCKIILEKHLNGTIDVKNEKNAACFIIEFKI
ncbi:PAS sensor-containing two-component system histidine kinase [Malaciobacter mytili LMG 24559]|nr:HAMP domain-containing sensor histidine kinase [Malaciobacter mytili]AXH14985.1 PAS sensor-containing two-component system histidine kinase [Malaciobacter mytili LMG 24559]